MWVLPFRMKMGKMVMQQVPMRMHTATGPNRGSHSVAGTPLVGARICTPRQSTNAWTAGQLSKFSELMQFILIPVEGVIRWSRNATKNVKLT